MLNHAFLIYAHAYPEQLKEIISLLAAPNHYCFINIDKKTKWAEKFIAENKSDHNIFLEGKERMEVTHGGYSQIEVTLRLLHKAYNQSWGGQIDYFHLISGQDFPIHSNMTFDKFFEKNEGKSYMEIESDEYHAKCMVRKYPSRVQPWYLMDIRHRDNRLINLYARIFNFISKHISWRKMIPGLWGGWNWFTWHRSVAQFVIQQEQTNPSFFRRFHHTSCGDELIFQTLLYPHISELNIEKHSLRYINWTKKAEGRNHVGSPLTLNEEEYEDIIKSGAFFCRKIDPVISKKLKDLLVSSINKE